MPCDCGPETRRLWEQVKDLMEHHDNLYDKWKKTIKERDTLLKENEVLRNMLFEKELSNKKSFDPRY